jgi:hypothetical protein
LDFTTRPRNGMTSASTPAAGIISVLFVIAVPSFLLFRLSTRHLPTCADRQTPACGLRAGKSRNAKYRGELRRQLFLREKENCRLRPRVHHRIKVWKKRG